MAARITDDEWDELTPENFDTTALLRAVDAVDVLRGDLNDSADGAPPQLRTDLLKLHQLAMAAFNEGLRSRVAELFDLAVDLQDQVDHLMIRWSTGGVTEIPGPFRAGHHYQIERRAKVAEIN